MKLYLNKFKWVYVALVISGVLVITACKNKKVSIKPEYKEIVESVYASARVKSANQYSAYAPISGVVKEILVTEGQQVVAGQVIARIQNSNLEYVAENARIGLNNAQTNLGGLEEIRAQLTSARKQHSLDSINLLRQQELWASNIGTKSQLEARQLANDVSKNSVAALETRYRQTQRQLNNAVNQAKNNVGSATVGAGDLDIKSRVTGTVYAINLKVGELIGPQIPLAVLGNSSNFILELDVDESDIANVAVDQLVYVRFDAYEGKVFEARISRILPNMNSKTQSFLVEAVLVTAPEKLYPGLSAEASIVQNKKSKALVIPITFLKSENTVITADGEKKVVTGLRNLEFVEIISGIDENTNLIKPE